MGQSIVKQFAFLPPPCSYDDKIDNFVWIEPPKRSKKIPALWFYSGPNAWTFLLTHGNAEDIGQNWNWLHQLTTIIPINLLIYDYEGYGLNGTHGECGEASCYKNIRDCYDWLVQTQNISPKKIVLYGRSLGSGPTTDLAYQLCRTATKSKSSPPIGAVLLQSPIASCVRVVSNKLAYLPFTDMFCNIDKIGSVSVPVYVIHGTRDPVVPFEHGKSLADKAKDNNLLWRFWTPPTGHNEIEHDHQDEFIGNMQEFISYLDSAELAAPASTSSLVSASPSPSDPTLAYSAAL